MNTFDEFTKQCKVHKKKGNWTKENEGMYKVFSDEYPANILYINSPERSMGYIAVIIAVSMVILMGPVILKDVPKAFSLMFKILVGGIFIWAAHPLMMHLVQWTTIGVVSPISSERLNKDFSERLDDFLKELERQADQKYNEVEGEKKESFPH